MEGVAEAVTLAAQQVHANFPRTWTHERDERCADWLLPAGVTWQSLVQKSQPEQKISSALEERIRALKDYGEYSTLSADIATLNLDETLALQEQLKKWGCDSNKAKGDKPKHWQALQKRLKELRKQSQ